MKLDKENRVRQLIKKCLIQELWKLEDRKKIKRELKDKQARRMMMEREEEENRQASLLAASPSKSASPMKMGMNYDKRSVTSPSRSKALDEQSQSVMVSDENKSTVGSSFNRSASKIGHHLLQPDPEGGISGII
jgi:hypothetical protein